MIQFFLTKKIFKIFTKQEKILFFSLIMTQFVSAGLELLSIGSLLPIFKAVTDPAWNEKYFSFLDEDNRIIYIFLIVIFIFIIKNIFLVQIAYYSGKFRNKVSLRIINTIYESYLNKEYQFHINNHSSLLLRNMNYADSIDSTIMRLVNFYSDLILALMSVIAVSFIDLRATLFAVIMLSFILICYAILTKLTVEKYGANSVNYNTSYLKNMMEGIRSYREILLSGKKDYFTSKNYKFKQQALRYKLRFQIIELVPKYIVELFFISSIISISGYFIIYGNVNLYEYLPFIGIILLGLLKILPNILRIFSSYQQFKFLVPVIEIVTKSLYDAKFSTEFNIINSSNESFDFSNEILLKNISFKYDQKTILKNINFKIKKNDFVAIQGESGSGKSTILNILSGLLLPTDGKILLDGKEKNLSNRKWQNKIGYVNQNTRLIDDTILSNITFGSDKKNIDMNFVSNLLERSGLKTYIENLENGINTVVGENGVKISGGQAQRIGLARAFYNNPEILILDEPTNSLDSENEAKIIDTLKNFKNQVTLIIVSHNEKPLKIADTKFLIKKGLIEKIS